MHMDKYKAKNNLWRIPERILLLVAFLGGSLGSLLGMYSTHHKTKHLKFTLSIPLLFLIHSIILTLLI